MCLDWLTVIPGTEGLWVQFPFPAHAYLHFMIFLQIKFRDGLNPCELSGLKDKAAIKGFSAFTAPESFLGEFCIILEKPSPGWKLSCLKYKVLSGMRSHS